jgi:hypothetical protein
VVGSATLWLGRDSMNVLIVLVISSFLFVASQRINVFSQEQN